MAIIETQDHFKKQAAKKALDFVQNNMIIGLGSGSTVNLFLEELGSFIKIKKINIVGVYTSNRTKVIAENFSIPVKALDEVNQIDLTIDGADEISAEYQGIKGGGASQLLEKIVASYSKRIVWIVDSSKMSDKLGKAPVPVEVIPYGSQHLLEKFNQKKLNPLLRLNSKGLPLQTHCQNYIIDLHLNNIPDPHGLNNYLLHQPGVVETGLFLDVVDNVIIGKDPSAQTISVKQ